MFDKLSAELGLKEDVLPKIALKLLGDIEKNFQRIYKDFMSVFLMSKQPLL